MKRLALLIAALTPLAHADVTAYNNQIGRASCRERV